MEFSMKDYFSKCDQNRRILSYLLKKSFNRKLHILCSVYSSLLIKMTSCFCGMVDRRKVFGLIPHHCQRSSPSRISNTPGAGFEPAQSLSSGFVERSCAVEITATPQPHSYIFMSHSTNFCRVT